MEIGIGTFEGCFGNMARKVFPMMSRNGEGSFMEIGIGTFGGVFWNYGAEGFPNDVPKWGK